MKYPGLPPAGSGTDLGWTHSGSDLGKALRMLEALDASDPTVGHAVQIAEVLRRAGQAEKAIDRARTAQQRASADTEHALLCLVEGTAQWTLGQGRLAMETYERAAQLSPPDSPEWRTAVLLGTARAGRVNLLQQAELAAEEALARARDGSDVHLLADALRERAAWALLRGEPALAEPWAAEAADTHDSVNDRYLAGHARVVLARAFNSAGDTESAITLVREQVTVGRHIGAQDLTMTASVFLGQFLQHGASPDSGRWSEARRVLLDALAEARDPFTEAELLLPLAHLGINSGDWPMARQALEEYESLFASLGGNAIADANAAKARARLRLAELGELPHGGFRAKRLAPALAAALLTLRRAERLYQRARLPAGARRVHEQRDLLLALAGSAGTRSSHAHDALGTDPLTDVRAGALAEAWAEVNRAVRLEQRGKVSEAADTFARAQVLAQQADSRMLAVASAARCAEAATAVGRVDLARPAIQQAVRLSETIRGAVDEGRARGRIAGSLRRHYERAALLAASLDDGTLLLEVLEALRTERLAGLMRGRVLSSTHPRLDALLAALNGLDEELARREQFGGSLRNASPSILAAPSPPSETASRETSDSPAASTRPAVGSGPPLAEENLARLQARRDQLHRALVAETGEVFAQVYDTTRASWDELAESLPNDVLSIVPIHADDEPPVLLSAWRSSDGEAGTATLPVTDEIARLRAVLIDASVGERPVLMAEHLACLTPLLPAGLLRRLMTAREPIDLVVIPSGWTWAVPFCALPLDDQSLLVDRATLTLTPSLRTHALLAARPIGPVDGGALSFGDEAEGRTAVRTELIALEDYPGGHRPVAEAADFRGLVTTAGTEYSMAAIAADGNRAPGLAQAVVDHRHAVVVAAADFLRPTAHPPALLSFGVCHGMYPPNDDQYEPLGLAVCALSAGAQAVIAAHFELDDAGGTAAAVLRGLYRATAHGASPAVALAAQQRNRGQRGGPLSRWAVLAVLGTGNRVPASRPRV